MGTAFSSAAKAVAAWGGGAAAAAPLGSYADAKTGAGAAAHRAARDAWHAPAGSVFAAWPHADRAAYEAFALD